MKYRVLAALAVLILVVSAVLVAAPAFADKKGEICYSRALDAWVEKPKTSYRFNDVYRDNGQERHVRVTRHWVCLEEVWYPSVERLDTGWHRH